MLQQPAHSSSPEIRRAPLRVSDDPFAVLQISVIRLILPPRTLPFVEIGT